MIVRSNPCKKIFVTAFAASSFLRKCPTLPLRTGWLALGFSCRVIHGGVIWITVGSLAFAFNDAVIKHLGAKFDPFQLAFARYLVGLVILGPVFISMGPLV